MFERTKTFWQRLLGKSAQTSTFTVDKGDDERRVWVRFPADVQTAVKPAGASDNVVLSARVRNISLGGINLLASREFQPGDLITIDLPGDSDETSCNVLACIVHCVEEDAGQWSLGCNFSRELSEDDLSCFGARRERHDHNDQREWKRFATNVSATFQQVTTDDPTPHPAQVLNVSATGVGLLVNRHLDNGALLSVDLHNATGTTERTMLACVVHINHQTAGEWALGCNFIRPLSEEDLKALV